MEKQREKRSLPLHLSSIPPKRGERGGSLLFRLLTFSLLFTLSTCLYSSGSPPEHPTDADLCTDLMSQAITALLSDSPLPSKSIVELAYPHGLCLSKTARTAMEACVTSRGYLLAGSARPEDYTLDIMVTDVSLILLKKDNPVKVIERTASITVHLLCKDTDRSVIFASGTTKTACDTLPKNLFRKTDNGYLFSPEIRRTVSGKSRTGIMAASLILISGVLIFFSSR